MTDLIKTELGSLTTTGIGHPRQGQAGGHTGSITVIGSGSVSATVLIRGSNDGQAWTTLATISASGTGTASGSAKWTDDYALLRQEVTALTGSVVSAQVVTDQTGGGASPASGGGAVVGASIAPVTARSIASTLPKYVAALRRAYQRKSPAIIMCLGDSTEANLGGNTGTNGYVGARKMSHAAQLARFLGYSDSGFVGCPPGTDVTPAQYDERISALGAGISINSNVAYMGGGLVAFANAASGAYTITPRGARGYDRVRVIYGRVATTGATNMSINVGGVSVGTFNARGGTGLGDVQSIEVSCPYSDPSVPISISGNAAPTDGACYIVAVMWWDASDPGVIVLNGGAPGTTAAQFTSEGNPWTCRKTLPVLAPDLTFLNLWINDTQFSTAPATYQNQLTTIRDYVAASSDIIYMGFQPINRAGMTDGQGDAIFNAMRNVAGASAVIDMRDIYGPTFAGMQALGLLYDDLHPTSLGQYYKAAYTASLIAP